MEDTTPPSFLIVCYEVFQPTIFIEAFDGRIVHTTQIVESAKKYFLVDAVRELSAIKNIADPWHTFNIIPISDLHKIGL